MAVLKRSSARRQSVSAKGSRRGLKTTSIIMAAIAGTAAIIAMLRRSRH
jgi:hypothetical protein